MKRRRCKPDPKQQPKSGVYSLKVKEKTITLAIARPNDHWTWQVTFVNGCWKMEDVPRVIQYCTYESVLQVLQTHVQNRWGSQTWNNWEPLVIELFESVVAYDPLTK